MQWSYAIKRVYCVYFFNTSADNAGFYLYPLWHNLHLDLWFCVTQFYWWPAELIALKQNKNEELP